VLWDKRIIGIKLSPYIASLSSKGKPPVTAYTLLMSAESGEPLLLCDSLLLTAIRTAATTSLALDYLIPHGARSLAIIGSGKVAQQHLRFVSKQHDWTRIAIYSPSLSGQTSIKAVERLSQLKSIQNNLVVCHSAQEAVQDADVVMLCTSSGKPVLNVEWLKENITVTSISTNSPRAHEIPPDKLHLFKVYCDYRRTAPLSAGEMIIAAEKYGWAPSSIIADLPELIAQKTHATTPPGRNFFRSIGLGLEDLAIASLLL